MRIILKLMFMYHTYSIVTNKVCIAMDILYCMAQKFHDESQMNLMNSQQLIKVFLTKLCPPYLSPMKPIINLCNYKSFHAGLIS